MPLIRGRCQREVTLAGVPDLRRPSDVRETINSNLIFEQEEEAMSKAKRKSGFTLVEVLIVVVIMAILAATIIPQFSDSTMDAKVSSAKFNLHTIRQQIETFKSQHDGEIPKIVTAGLPALTGTTNKAGTVGTGTGFIYGPYLKDLPANPFNGSKTVVATTAEPPTAEVDGAGYLYNETLGKIYVNSPNDEKKLPFTQQ